MKWPWKRIAEGKDRAEQAEVQAEAARAEYNKTVQNGRLVSETLAALFYHAEKNRIVESIQKVARGH